MGCDLGRIFNENRQLFCSPTPYLVGAGSGLVVAALTHVTDPLPGALFGAPLGPVAWFVYNSLTCLNTGTTLGEVARVALALFITLALGTAVASVFGATITFAHGSLVMLTGLVAAVSTGILAYQEGWFKFN